MLETRGRFFELYAPSDEEREMWMNAFDYVIKSTRIVTKLQMEQHINVGHIK